MIDKPVLRRLAAFTWALCVLAPMLPVYASIAMLFAISDVTKKCATRLEGARWIERWDAAVVAYLAKIERWANS